MPLSVGASVAELRFRKCEVNLVKRKGPADEDDSKRYVFLARYKKVGVNQWIRIGRPEIDISDDPWPSAYRDPQIRRPRQNVAEIRVRDARAVNLEVDSLLGNYSAAADHCDNALLRTFSGDVIVNSLSFW